MKNFCYIFLVFFFVSLDSNAQTPFGVDSVLSRADSALLAAKNSFPKNWDSVIYSNHPFYKFSNPKKLLVQKRKWDGKEKLFYTIIALIIFFAAIRNGFSRYMHDIFKVFFRTTLNQRQVKEQMLQAPLPSLLLNIFYFLSGALFITLVFDLYSLGTQFNFWLLLLYSFLGLLAIYLVKFITLKFSGWVFRLSEVTNSYIFIVFTTNKIIGITLIPFIILLAFTVGNFQQAALKLGLIVVGLLFLYRYYLSYSSIHQQIRFNFFHFLIYLCAFEIAPLLLINKLLFRFLN